ncbi:Uba ts-n domain-containing protein [Lasiodiplodia theobromae]|uniref:Uba ts-n domain-containing protein n=1 Tax=Lasiodiplodia theobromae TaxID=45133 RepID=UPI0015C3D235|nr:Uba ts-n domain-containing protein [Lasiodiplodia theobromae]KAF4534651.1 Uba ts-n domain-containing protein [Lasiodiplodia theobromae]
MTSRAHLVIKRECLHCQDCERRSDWDFLRDFFAREERLVGYARGLEYQVRNLHLALARGAQDVQAATHACNDLARQLEEIRNVHTATQAELALKDDRLNDFELDLQDRRRQLVEYQSESAKDREMITKMKQFLSDFIHGNVEDVLDSLEECEEVLDALGEEKQERAASSEREPRQSLRDEGSE